MSYKDIQKKIFYLRHEYMKSGLCRKNLPDNPMILFKQWLTQAFDAQLPDPNAMVLATVDKYGQPYQRFVLLKNFDILEMIFYTNLNSRKAQHIFNNQKVSLHFPWLMLERQVMVLGNIEKLTTTEVLKYFNSRPEESKISAWVSKQSSVILNRNVIENKFINFQNKFKLDKIPLPNFWGGYRVKYHTIEFWQGRRYRLHDRFLYQYNPNYNNWTISRLSP